MFNNTKGQFRQFLCPKCSKEVKTTSRNKKYCDDCRKQDRWHK